MPEDKKCVPGGHYINRGVTVDGLIIRDGQILLVKRGHMPYQGFWAFPGGFVGWDESADEAVIREVLEETGLRAKILGKLPFRSDPKRHMQQVMTQPYLLSVEGQAVAGDDAAEVRWFDLEHLPEQLAFDHASILAPVMKAMGISTKQIDPLGHILHRQV